MFGEENGVDQFRLAARELGDKGDGQFVGSQGIDGVPQAAIGVRIPEPVLFQPDLIALFREYE